MNTVLRGLVVANWVVAGVGLLGAAYFYPFACEMAVTTVSLRVTFPDGIPTPLPADKLREWRGRMPIVKKGLREVAASGQWAWWSLAAVGCVNAVGLQTARRVVGRVEAIKDRIPATGAD